MVVENEMRWQDHCSASRSGLHCQCCARKACGEEKNEMIRSSLSYRLSSFYIEHIVKESKKTKRNVEQTFWQKENLVSPDYSKKPFLDGFSPSSLLFLRLRLLLRFPFLLFFVSVSGNLRVFSSKQVLALKLRRDMRAPQESVQQQEKIRCSCHHSSEAERRKHS